MKLSSKLLMVFGWNLCEERQIWVYEPHFWEVRDTRPWLMARWKAHGRLSIRINWALFAVYYSSGVMRLNVYSSAVFAGDRPLGTQILHGKARAPPNTLGVRKLETLGASLCIPSFWHNTGVWRTDGFAVNLLALWHTVKMINSCLH